MQSGREASRSGGGRIVIVGAGPCGLACARELERLGHREWTVLEREEAAGGHAGSVRDPRGFTWDYGGHVVFSHFGEFDALLEEVLGTEVELHDRSSFIRLADRWIPYPFQNNLRYLPAELAYDCVVGLIDAPGGSAELDFARWLEVTFGDAITREFMRPYNSKVWATPLQTMSSKWIAERVSVVDFRRALRNVILGLDDAAWGPNNRFAFPRSGGTGEIYRRLAGRLGERVRYGAGVVEVDAGRRRLRLATGEQEEYDALVSTMPLDCLVTSLSRCPSEIRAAAAALVHNSVLVVGVGYESALDDNRSWMYFPEATVPFYRVTNFAKYAAANVPDAAVDRFCSYLTETAYSLHKPEDLAAIADSTVAGLASTGIAPRGAEIASVHVIDAPYAYPVPTLARDRALATIQPWLMKQGIYSRGRFGSWRYEVGNMDHAVKMGVDAARLLVEGRVEELWRS